MDNDKKFSFGIGRPWYPEDINSPINVYAYHHQIQYGNMKEAKEFKEYCDRTLTPEQLSSNPYRIYKLVEVTYE